MKKFFLAASVFAGLIMAAAAGQKAWAGTPFVPGTGEFLADCCDDFEDPNWSFRYNHPKSSHEQDKNQRSPGGRSANGLWHEGGKRGTPDVVKRVPTPPGGLPDSTGALLFATKNSGIPGRISNQQQQDDLLMLFNQRLGRSIPIAWQPSCTVRVYLPPFDDWERRSGAQFGMRADCLGRKPDGEVEEYWPGMFLLFRPANRRGNDKDAAKLTIRADRTGHDVRSLDIHEPGWWTLGLSFTADGQVHYYASPGVDDLTSEDYLMSSFPYNMRCVQFNNFFFNVANWDNGRTWSTHWVIDDPQIFVIPPQGQSVANLHRNRSRQQASRSTPRQTTTGRKTPTNSRAAARGQMQR
jgi:hypothetical protein